MLRLQRIMRFFKRIPVVILVGLAALTGAQGQGYRITVEIEGVSDDMLLLGNFYGERTYVKDTAFNEDGTFVFEGENPLENGMYFAALGKTRIFDFIIFNDQEFTLSTAAPDYLEHMEVQGSEENMLFVNDMRFNQAMNQEASPLLKVLQDSTASEEARENAREAMSGINRKVQVHQNEILNEHPDSFLATIFNAQKTVPAPEGLDQAEALQYYRAHYWDNFDLADPVFLRLNLPLFQEKVNNYLDRLYYQHPDSLRPAIDLMAEKASANEDTYKYLIWMLTLKYQNPSIMGLDALFVHLYDTYFASGEMDYWANDQLKKNLADMAGPLRKSLIGGTAPNMIMLDQNLERKSLYDIDREFTLIYFFDPDCSHCKKATPILDQLYDSSRFDMEVYAVSTDTSMVKMKEYIRDFQLDWITVNGPRTETAPYYTLYDAMTTPTIYVLDRDKKIIAKKLPAERIEEFLTRYLAERQN